METKTPLITQQILPLAKLEENTGQLPGLPENPRYITPDKMQKLINNITEHPELLDYRSLLVYPLDNGNYIIIGGNQRLKALQSLGYTEAPCIIMDKSTPVERLKAITVLDNASFGKFDMESLANMWDDVKLDGFGVDIPTFAPVPIDGLFEQSTSKGDGEEHTPDKITIIIPDELEDNKEEILDFVREILNEDYPGCSVSFKK